MTDKKQEITLKGGQKTLDIRLDRVVEFDEKSRDYPITAVIPTTRPRSRTWSLSVWNDQGREGACVGFAWSHEISAQPYAVRTNAALATQIYKEAQKIDEWPGENYSGTSVLAGAKVVTSMGYMREYRWAFGVDDLILAVGHAGPAVIGINWYEGMYNTDAKGFIRPTGQQTGGHAILVKGVTLYKKDYRKVLDLENIDRDRSFFILHNSWGRRWGKVGQGYVTINDMNTLLEQHGECCIPVYRGK